jgi:transcriptional regulator with XRE-family HTH domain
MADSFSFGYWLRRQRLARDLRQADLAGRLGVAPITLRKIEADERRPSLQLLARIAELFALSEGERALPLRVSRADLSPAALPLAERALAAEPEVSAGDLPAQPSPRPPDVRRHWCSRSVPGSMGCRDRAGRGAGAPLHA